MHSGLRREHQLSHLTEASEGWTALLVQVPASIISLPISGQNKI